MQGWLNPPKCQCFVSPGLRMDININASSGEVNFDAAGRFVLERKAPPYGSSRDTNNSLFRLRRFKIKLLCLAMKQLCFFVFFLRLPTKLWGGWFVHGKQACAGTTAQSQGAGSDSSAANTLPAAPPHIRKYYKQRARSFNFTYTQACNCDHNCTVSYLRNKLQLFKRCYICIFLWYFYCSLWEY